MRWSWLCLPLSLAFADDQNHQYDQGEAVVVWADRFGPFRNPQETYPMSGLPLCEAPKTSVPKHLTLGEALAGHSFVLSPYIGVLFGREKGVTGICNVTLTDDVAVDLARMVADNVWFVYYLDDLPVYGFLGQVEMEGNELVDVKLFSHRKLLLEKNENRIVGVTLEQSNLIPIRTGQTINFTYEVLWKDSDIPFAKRFERYASDSFFDSRSQKISLANSLIISFCLCVVVGFIIITTLRRDLAHYAASDLSEIESLDRFDDGGWKQVHADVFRRPAYLTTFSALISSGVHVALVVAIVCFLAAIGGVDAYEPGSLASCTAATFVSCQLFAGIVGGYVYRLYEGKGWKNATTAQVTFLPVVCLVLFSFQHATAVARASTLAMPTRLMALSVALFFLVCVPLHFLGFLAGRRLGSKAAFPCRTHNLRRPIPQKSNFFMPTLILLCGGLIFGSIFLELNLLFHAVWSYRNHVLYSLAFAIFLLALFVIVCVSITATYVLLNAEDYRWPWLSFAACASTGILAALFALYYYRASAMGGALQFYHYFASTAFFCVCLSLFSGSMGYLGASHFVWLMYKQIRVD